MIKRHIYARSIILFDAVFVVFACLAFYHLSQKAYLPGEFARAESIVINGLVMEGGDAIEFYASAGHIGDVVSIQEFPAAPPAQIRLVPYYSTASIIFDAMLLLLLGALGTFVYLFRPDENASVVFHVAALTVAAGLAGTKTIYSLQPVWLGVSACILFFIAYALIPVVVVHFTFVFPTVRWKNFRTLVVWLYLAAGVIAIWHAERYLHAAAAHSMEMFRALGWISMVENAFVFVLLVAGVLNFSVSYRRTSSLEEKKKIRWILFGLCIGPAPFIFLWALPEALGLTPWIPEVIFKVFLMIIPVTFAVAILRHHAIDIDLIINRSAVYGIVLGVGLAVYIGIVGVSAKIVASLTHEASLIISAVTAAVLAFLFEPARRRVQRFVDKTFFRVQYDFRETLRAFLEEIKQCLDVQHIADILLRRTDELLPVERIGFFRVNEPNARMTLMSHKNFQLLTSRGITLDIGKLKSSLLRPLALEHLVEPGVNVELAERTMFERWGMALVFPMLSEQREILGFLVLGGKKSGARFTAEDVDLLQAVSAQAALTIERINLQQKLLVERAETQRLEELSRLKSYFVSSVSHDLKTPLASIRMFAELLRTRKKLPAREAKEYLEIIEGESERLGRLINNVLDFSKVERGEKEYTFNIIELNDLVKNVLRLLAYQLKLEKFTVRSGFCKGKCFIRADADAVTEALINLFTNAMKYSPDEKEITVSTYTNGQEMGISVADRGIGITAEDLPHIVEPFYRARVPQTQGTGGAGLGLALVKSVMDAHGGKLDVTSLPGKGSTFRLVFPRPSGGSRSIFQEKL